MNELLREGNDGIKITLMGLRLRSKQVVTFMPLSGQRYGKFINYISTRAY